MQFYCIVKVEKIKMYFMRMLFIFISRMNLGKGKKIFFFERAYEFIFPRKVFNNNKIDFIWNKT